MKYFLRIIALLFFCFIFNSCKKSLIKEDMVLLDQSFIPAYYYANKGDLENTKNAVLSLEEHWQHYKNSYKKYLIAEEWKTRFIRMNDRILYTNEALVSEDLFDVLIQLDHFRFELIEARWQNDIAYYLDNLWEVEASLMVVVDVANSPIIDILEWEEFYDLCEDLKHSWIQCKEKQIDNDLYKLYFSGENGFSNKQTEMETLIVGFLEAVELQNTNRVADYLEKLEPTYFELLKCYGDFSRTDNTSIVQVDTKQK